MVYGNISAEGTLGLAETSGLHQRLGHRAVQDGVPGRWGEPLPRRCCFCSCCCLFAEFAGYPGLAHAELKWVIQRKLMKRSHLGVNELSNCTACLPASLPASHPGTQLPSPAPPTRFLRQPGCDWLRQNLVVDHRPTRGYVDRP